MVVLIWHKSKPQAPLTGLECYVDVEVKARPPIATYSLGIRIHYRLDMRTLSCHFLACHPCHYAQDAPSNPLLFWLKSKSEAPLAGLGYCVEVEARSNHCYPQLVWTHDNIEWT